MVRIIQIATIAFLLTFIGVSAGFADQEQGKKVVASEKETPVNPTILMKTSMGDIVIELFADKAPVTVANFLSYTEEKFYDGTVFHRVIPNFMIQGGGWTEDLNRKTTKDPIQNEAANGLSNKRGTIAMARLPEPHTATSQFFINVVDNPRLDHFDEGARFGYCVFGEVVEGMDVVDKIRNVPTGAKGPLQQDVPLETVKLISVTKIEPESD